MTTYKIIWIISLSLMLITACAAEPGVAERGEDLTNSASGEIVVGVAWPFSVHKDLLEQGVDLAVNEINKAGGVKGRKIQLIKRDDESSPYEGKLIAQELADKPEVVAVIGHFNSGISIPASTIYQFSNILMISPGSTNPKLTQQDFGLVFRNLPSDAEIGRQLAEYAADQGYQQVMILFAKDAYGRGLSNVFEQEATPLGMTVLDRVSYRAGEDDFREIIDNWRKFDFDAIFLAGTTPEMAHFIRQAKEAGINVPMISGDGLATTELWEVAGDAAEGTIVASFFHPHDPRVEVQQFTKTFQDKYGTPPEVYAAQGYDAVKLLAYAMEQANSTNPHQVAETLHDIKDWPGVTGPHTFDDKGDVINKKLVLTIVQRNDAGDFEFGIIDQAAEELTRP